MEKTNKLKNNMKKTVKIKIKPMYMLFGLIINKSLMKLGLKTLPELKGKKLKDFEIKSN